MSSERPEFQPIDTAPRAAPGRGGGRRSLVVALLWFARRFRRRSKRDPPLLPASARPRN